MRHEFPWVAKDAKCSTCVEPVTELSVQIDKRDDGKWVFNGFEFPTEQDARDAAEAYSEWAIVRHGLSASKKASEG